MNKEERIRLRNELFNEFKLLGIINKQNHLLRSKLEKINDNLNTKWQIYLNQFRSKEEAIYCILNYDDFENHRCSNCNNICLFYEGHHKFYIKTCGSKECIKLAVDIEEMKRKYRETCEHKYGVENPSQLNEIKQKKKETFNKNHPKKIKINDGLTTEERKRKTNLDHRGVEYPTQDAKVKEKVKATNLKKCGTEYPFQQHIQHYDIWRDNDKFINYIKEQYILKKSFLVVRDIQHFFNVKESAVRKRIRKLKILNYFYIKKSNIELNFQSFLNDNNIQYKRRDRSILRYDNNKFQEIDFLCGNIGFEINDIVTHNSSNKNDYTYKDPLYHQQKSLLAQEKNIELIHIWEWELRNEEIWNKLSKWILNKFNIKKIIDISECDIQNIDEVTAETFSNLYNINNFENNNNHIGIYYKEELIQVISINLLTTQSNIITKFGFSIFDKNKQLINYCNQKINIQSLYSLCDFSKDNGNELNQLGFKYIDTIEPNSIWCNKKMEIFNEYHDYCIPIYNCGYNKYELTL